MYMPVSDPVTNERRPGGLPREPPSGQAEVSPLKSRLNSILEGDDVPPSSRATPPSEHLSPGARAAGLVMGSSHSSSPYSAHNMNGNARENVVDSASITRMTTPATQLARCVSNHLQAEDFGIVVAVRVRPFNRKEIENWAAEQRKKQCALSNRAAAALSATARRNQRQPFGPGCEALNGRFGSPTPQSSSPVTPAGIHVNNINNNNFVVGSESNFATSVGALDEKLLDTEPIPIVDVGSGDASITLLDPNNPATARGVFTYDHVFSSFAPSVEIIDLMDGVQGVGASAAGNHCKGFYYGRNNAMNSAELDTSLGTVEGLTPNLPPIIAGEEVDMDPRQQEQAEAEQVSLFNTLALPLIDSVVMGYNACVFAYGQTSSGKTYTMMGTKQHRGLTPRICHELFRRIDLLRQAAAPSTLDANSRRGSKRSSTSNKSGSSGGIRVDVSYMEIYNEQVRDLLKQRPKNAILHYANRFDKRDVNHQEYQNLKVRHHPSKGLFVEGLTTVTVNSWEECREYIRTGSLLRTQACTEMNANSSRSHAIFQLVLTQSEQTGGKVRGRNVLSHRISKFNLVDLAGSERNNSLTQASGKHLAEANSINVSLATLRRVIDGLVSKKKTPQVIPYRESLLTYVLSDNFGGNSKTVMCANISPSPANLAETESTLRYATIARGVLNRVKVNEDPQAKIIRELKERMRGLQEELAIAHSMQALSPNNGSDSARLLLHEHGGEMRRGSPSVSSVSSRAGRYRISDLETGFSKREAIVGELREREYRLRHTLNEHQTHEQQLRETLLACADKEEHWRKEALRHKTEKDALKRAVRALAMQNPALLIKRDRVLANVVNTTETDDSVTAAGTEGSILSLSPPLRPMPLSKDAFLHYYSGGQDSDSMPARGGSGHALPPSPRGYVNGGGGVSHNSNINTNGHVSAIGGGKKSPRALLPPLMSNSRERQSSGLAGPQSVDGMSGGDASPFARQPSPHRQPGGGSGQDNGMMSTKRHYRNRCTPLSLMGIGQAPSSAPVISSNHRLFSPLRMAPLKESVAQAESENGSAAARLLQQQQQQKTGSHQALPEWARQLQSEVKTKEEEDRYVRNSPRSKKTAMSSQEESISLVSGLDGKKTKSTVSMMTPAQQEPLPTPSPKATAATTAVAAGAHGRSNSPDIRNAEGEARLELRAESQPTYFHSEAFLQNITVLDGLQGEEGDDDDDGYGTSSLQSHSMSRDVSTAAAAVAPASDSITTASAGATRTSTPTGKSDCSKRSTVAPSKLPNCMRRRHKHAATSLARTPNPSAAAANGGGKVNGDEGGSDGGMNLSIQGFTVPASPRQCMNPEDGRGSPGVAQGVSPPASAGSRGVPTQQPLTPADTKLACGMRRQSKSSDYVEVVEVEVLKMEKPQGKSKPGARGGARRGRESPYKPRRSPSKPRRSPSKPPRNPSKPRRVVARSDEKMKPVE